jgi:hypothetical protein
MSLHGFSGGADVDPSSRRGSEGEKKGPGGIREFPRIIRAGILTSNIQL